MVMGYRHTASSAASSSTAAANVEEILGGSDDEEDDGNGYNASRASKKKEKKRQEREAARHTALLKENHGHMDIYNGVVENIGCVRDGIIMFPMVSSGYDKNRTPYHWTLLTCNMAKEKWWFYNSMKPRGNRRDPFLTNAKDMKAVFEENMDVLLKKAGKSGFPKYDVEPIKGLPQQDPSLNECAVYICFYMDRILQKMSIPKKIDQDDLQVFKAQIIHTILM